MKTQDLSLLLQSFPAKAQVLVAPLNWGIGHASRCIPIIRQLIAQDFQPVIASDGAALLLLQQVFPQLETYELPAYKVRYAANARLFHLKILSQLYHFYKTYQAEKRVINQIIQHRKIEVMLSDNRFGVFSKQAISIYMTHQLRVKSGITTYLTTQMHRFFIRNFDRIWVPDIAESPSLSGDLSHGIRLQKPLTYLGWLSPFKKEKLALKYDILILLSGPEPQRTILEKKLLKSFANSKKKICLIRGKLAQEMQVKTVSGMRVYNYLYGKALQNLLNQSQLVIARSGYSTIMDLAVLQKKAFFIPTPGQGEQIYLAEHLEKQQIAPFSMQNDFSIEKLAQINNYKGF